MSNLDHIRVITSDPGPKQYLWRNEPDVKDWDTFVTWIKASEGHDWKYDRPYVAGTYTWSEQGDRKGVHLVERHVITLDADAAGHDYLERLAEVADWKRLSHTTASHMKDGKGPRWRTLIPLSRAASPSEYLTLSLYLREQIGAERLDKSASTSPAAVAYAPAWDGVAYDEVDGPVLDVDGLLLVVELLEWHPTTSVPDATVAEFLHEHPSEGQPCAYGRVALDRVADELEDFPADDGAGFHQKIGNAGMRFVEMVLAGCWSADDVDRLREAANHRAEPRPKEFDEAIAYGLGKGCVAATNCEAHGGPAPADVFDAIEGEITDEPGELSNREKRVMREVERLDILAEARSRIAARDLNASELPSLVSLDDFLAVPDEDAEYRIAGLWPTGGRVLFAAAQKAGKTTTTGNAIRALVDGDPFLSTFETKQAGRVVLIDNELDQRMLRRWLREHGIQNANRVDVLCMRGKLSTFNILDPVIRARWAQIIGAADVLVFDCLRPALDALALSEDKEAGRFLTAFDELITEAGIPEALMVHHMGHSNERSRGDSRILDWPDALWKLVREDPEAPMSPRYFSAYGRDVDQAEVQLAYSDFDRRLSIGGGSRKEAKTAALGDDVIAFLAENPGVSQTAIEKALGGDRMKVRSAIRALAEEGRILVAQVGQKRAHSLAGGVS